MPKNLDILFFLGRPLSPLYGLAMRMREELYLRGIFCKHLLPVPVISVGNLVMGGTGKTPTVRYLAELLKAKGYHPAIISRGYGGEADRKVNIVSDREQVRLDPRQAGDEPYMLALALPGTPVLTGKRRIDPARLAIESFQADVLLLDDGFQHLALGRDIDLVLFDGANLAGNSRIFPGGVLREPISALQRCTAFLLTGITENNRRRAELFAELLQRRFGNKPVFYSCLGRFDLKDAANVPGSAQPAVNKIPFAFCGIANPARFSETLEKLGMRQAGFLALPDHVNYSQSLVEDICGRARACGATHLVTTEKDYVKLARLKVSLPLEFLQIHACHDESFDRFIFDALGTRK